jgi:hypothetical protein
MFPQVLYISGRSLLFIRSHTVDIFHLLEVHTMGYVVASGKSNWLEGIILMCKYIPFVS